MVSKDNSLPSSSLPWYKPQTWLRSLYAWVIHWAEKPGALKGLAILSAAEAIFFPIPVDPMILAMGTAKPKKALWYAFVATVFSVTGALIGYWLGYTFWNATQDFFYQYVFSEKNFNLVLKQFQDNAFLAIFLAGFTPIPFKVFTLAAGVAHLSMIPFVTGCIAGRAGRYFIIGGLLYFFGPPIRDFIEKYLERISLITSVVVVAAFLIYKFI